MPSIAYKMTEKLFFHTVRSIMGDSRAAFTDYVFSMAEKRSLEVPSARWQSSFDYEEVTDGETTLVKIASRGSAHQSLLFYLTGDGLFQPPSLADFELCGKLARETGRDVWLLSYPLIPQAGPVQIMESVMKYYRLAAGRYGAGQIAVMGLSSGCQLALGICHLLREEGGEDKYPELLLLQSPPLRLPPDPEQLEQMRAAEARDCVFPADYYRWIASIADFGECEYLLRPLEGSLSGLPPIYAFFGEYETAAVYEPLLRARCGEDGVRLYVFTGEKMMHNWCLLSGTPEAGKVRDRFRGILKSS